MSQNNRSNLQRRNQSYELYNWLYSSIYAAEPWLHDPDYALTHDPWVYETIERDAKFKQLIRIRAHLTAGREWNLDPGEATPGAKFKAQIVEDGLKHIKRFGEALFRLSKAFLRGHTIERVHGKIIDAPLGDGIVRRWWVPTLLKDVDKRRMRQRIDPDTGKLTWQLWEVRKQIVDAATGRARLVMGDQWQDITHPGWFVQHVYHNTEENLDRGSPLSEALYMTYYSKQKVLKEGLQGLMRWSQGIIAAKISSLREGAVDQDNEAEADKWLDVIEKMRSRYALVYGADDDVEVFETSGRGHDIVFRFLEFFNQEASGLLLGSVLPSGGGQDVGSNARAQTERGMTDDDIAFDRECLGATITDSLVRLFLDVNRANFIQLGIDHEADPTFAVVFKEPKDREREARVVQVALQAGVSLKKTEVHENLGYSMPAPDDEVYEGAAKAPAPAGFGPGIFPNPAIGQFAEALLSAGVSPDVAVRTAQEHYQQPDPPPNFNINVPVNIPDRSPSVHVDNHVDIPRQEPQPAPIVNMAAPKVDVHVPKQDAPVVNVAAPKITVDVPTPKVTVQAPVTVTPPKQPDVIVNVPKQPAPVVNIENKIEAPKGKKEIRLTRDADGKITKGTIEPKG